MKKFLVLYRAPVSVLEEWKKTSPEKRDAEEKKMRGEWQKWMKEHGAMLAEQTAGVGAVKSVTSEGVSDTHNDIMLYSTVEAESSDVAAQAFTKHPHLQIPKSSIEVMPINYLPGMQ